MKKCAYCLETTETPCDGGQAFYCTNYRIERKKMNQPEFRIPEAYPFLRIAKQYGADYTHVLQYADWLRHKREQPQYRDDLISCLPDEVRREIVNATKVQLLVANGKIDWQTGETLC